MDDLSPQAWQARALALEARLRAVSGAVADVYHDVSNPVSALTGNIELLGILVDEGEVDEGLRATARDLEAALERLHETLDGLRKLRNALRADEPL